MTEDELDALESAASWLRADSYNSDSVLSAKAAKELADQIQNIADKYRQILNTGSN